MAGLTLITPTGGRPEAFALCESMMAAQTYKGPLQWIVVDDCLPLTMCLMQQFCVLPRPVWSPGQNTQGRNLLAALPHVQHDNIVIIEDDDYYAPNYLGLMLNLLGKADLVGVSHAQYYNVLTRTYRQHSNVRHASLCTTAMRRPVLEMLAVVCEERAKWIDIELWARWTGTKLLVPPTNPSSAVGIKGLPGRPGIGRGHVMDPTHGFSFDRNMTVLGAWIGEASECYRGYYRGEGNGH